MSYNKSQNGQEKGCEFSSLGGFVHKLPKKSHDWELVARCKICGFLVRLNPQIHQNAVWAHRTSEMPSEEGEVDESYCRHQNREMPPVPQTAGMDAGADALRERLSVVELVSFTARRLYHRGASTLSRGVGHVLRNRLCGLRG